MWVLGNEIIGSIMVGVFSFRYPGTNWNHSDTMAMIEKEDWPFNIEWVISGKWNIITNTINFVLQVWHRVVRIHLIIFLEHPPITLTPLPFSLVISKRCNELPVIYQIESSNHRPKLCSQQTKFGEIHCASWVDIIVERLCEFPPFLHY